MQTPVGGARAPRSGSPFWVIWDTPFWSEAYEVEASTDILSAPGPTHRLSTSLRSKLPAGAGIVVLPVCAAGAAVLALALSRGLGNLTGPVLALLLAATLAEAFPVPIESVAPGETSFANVFIAAAAALYGWRSAVLVGVLTMLLVEVYRRRPPMR